MSRISRFDISKCPTFQKWEDDLTSGSEILSQIYIKMDFMYIDILIIYDNMVI